MIIVAHRLRLARGADRIVVLEDGRVVEAGAPDELRRHVGPYAGSSTPSSPRPDRSMTSAGWSAWSRRVVGGSSRVRCSGRSRSAPMSRSSRCRRSSSASRRWSGGVAEVAWRSPSVRVLAIARAAFRYLERYVTHTVVLRSLADLRVWFSPRSSRSPRPGSSTQRSGDLVGRIVADIDTLERFSIRVLAPSLTAHRRRHRVPLARHDRCARRAGRRRPSSSRPVWPCRSRRIVWHRATRPTSSPAVRSSVRCPSITSAAWPTSSRSTSPADTRREPCRRARSSTGPASAWPSREGSTWRSVRS